MATPISYLRVLRRNQRDDAILYRYTLCDLPGAPEYAHLRAQPSRVRLEGNLQDAAERLRQISTGAGVDGAYTFGDLGEMLAAEYLPPPVVEYLFSATTPLILQTNDPEFPWDIVRYGGKPLGAFRPLSRVIPARQPAPLELDRWGPTRQALLVGDTLSDSTYAVQEISELRQALQRYREPYRVPEPLLGPAATKYALSAALQHGVEFLHIAGHILYGRKRHGTTPEIESAIICAHSEPLTVSDLRSLGGHYAFVYLSGCAGGRTMHLTTPIPDDRESYLLSSNGREVDGLALPFLEGGASVFVSTLWRVKGPSAYAFAHAFYQQALQGMPLGEALRRVKEAWLGRADKDPTWGAYLMYGNPLLTLDTVRDPERLADEATQTVSQYALVSIPPHEMSTQFRSPRVAQFLRRFAPDDAITLDEGAQRILEETLAWVDQMRWHLITRFDLLVGMARAPGGMVERGLRAFGVSPAELYELNIQAFGYGKRRLEQPLVSAGVYTAIIRAITSAMARADTVVREDDLVAGLLELPAAGSLRAALKGVQVESQDVLAAARGALVATPQQAQRPQRLSSTALMRSPRGATKMDATPRSMLTDLRAKIADAVRDDRVPPFVGREAELFDILRVLTRGDDSPHVVVHGPIGVGSQALAEHIAARVVAHPEAADTAALASWDLKALRLTRASEKVSDWLPKELHELRGPTLIVLQDLPALLAFEGVAETLMKALRHPSLRVLATAHTDAYRHVRWDVPAIAALLTAIPLEPPREDEAQRMVAAHKSRLEQHYHAQIEPAAITAALSLWRAEAPLSLPGAAITRLERACARKISSGNAPPDQSALLTRRGAPNYVAPTETRPAEDPLRVTEQDVRDAAP